MKTILTKTCAAAFVLALTLAGAKAQDAFTNALDSKTGWGGVGGGDAKTNTSWTVDTGIYAPDGSTASFNVYVTNFIAGGFVDLYTDGILGGVKDFSSNNFSIWFRSDVTNAPLRWRLVTATDLIFYMEFSPSAANTWQQFSFVSTNFTDTPANLTNVNLIQLQFYGDSVGSAPAQFYVDSMNIDVIPEPSSIALLGLAAVGVGGLAWRKRRRALS